MSGDIDSSIALNYPNQNKVFDKVKMHEISNGSDKKFKNNFTRPPNLLLPHSRPQRQAQHRIGYTLRERKISLSKSIFGIRLLQMRRNGIVNHGLNTFLCQRCFQLVALRGTNHEQMINMLRFRMGYWKHNITHTAQLLAI